MPPEIPLASRELLNGLVISMRKREQHLNAEFKEEYSSIFDNERNKRL